MGKDYPYYCLWRLLEPEALSTYDAFNAYPPEARRQHFIRRTKEEMVYLNNTPIYPTRSKERQHTLEARKAEALAVLRRESELIIPGAVTFLAHALVVPSSDAEDQKRQDARAEAIAMQYVRADEEARGALVKDVSTVRGAGEARLQDQPDFDLRSIRQSGQERAIEVPAGDPLAGHAPTGTRPPGSAGQPGTEVMDPASDTGLRFLQPAQATPVSACLL